MVAGGRAFLVSMVVIDQIFFIKGLMEKRIKKTITLFQKAMSSRKSPSWSSKGWKENTGLKPGLVATGGSQSSQEQWTKESPGGSRWKEVTNVLHETGLLIKERKASWHKSCKEMDTHRRV